MNSDTKLPIDLNDVPLSEKLPPLVLIAFTRPELLKEVLIGISQQSLLPQEIIAFIDGARHTNDRRLIEECISLLKKFSTTVPVEIVTREHNLGCDQNVILALTEVLSRYDSLIYLEDDTVPNCYFYNRMCRLLQAYKEHKQVFSVSAYANFPEGLDQLIDSDFFVSNRVFALGFGIWADRWQEIDLANQPKQYNPFGSFYNIPATIQTKYTIVNQFWLEKNNKTDWVITLTVAALYKKKIHIISTTSLVRNIGFGHTQAKTYSQGGEPAWANAKYDSSAYPNRLPSSLDLCDLLKSSLSGVDLAFHLSKQQDLWLSPLAIISLLKKYPDFYSAFLLIKIFLTRMPIMLRRLRSGLPI